MNLAASTGSVHAAIIKIPSRKPVGVDIDVTRGDGSADRPLDSTVCSPMNPHIGQGHVMGRL